MSTVADDYSSRTDNDFEFLVVSNQKRIIIILKSNAMFHILVCMYLWYSITMCLLRIT